jgi:hypothetical protein
MWTNAGADPKNPAGTTAITGLTVLEQNRPQAILTVAGPRSVSSIKLMVPGVTPATVVTDSGRAHRGFSQFRVAVDPDNGGVLLSRRMDYGIADQRARVLIDGVLAGEWFDPGSDSSYRWRDSPFPVPAALTAGKSALTVRVEFISSANDWNEFRYRVHSSVGGTAVLTDSVDVADPASETAHSYAIGTQTWTGTQTFCYPSRLTDTGRAHTGASQFTLSIDSGNTDVILARRMDHGIPDQRAIVLIDGLHAGVWEDLGTDEVHRWRDSSFAIPAALTAGKSSIAVRIEFASSGLDWNEFTYWAYSRLADGSIVRSDTLDVGAAASEAAHAYRITGQTWSGTLVAGYDTAELLNSTRIRMFWDGAAAASVDATPGPSF